MPEAVSCTKCGSSDCRLMENKQYLCNHCGARFYLADAEYQLAPDGSRVLEMEKPNKKQVVNIIFGVILVGAIFGYGIYSTDKSTKNGPNAEMESSIDETEENDIAPKYTEVALSFQAVPGKDQLEIWLINRRNSSNLKEVDYRLSIINPVSGKEIYTKPVISTMTWDQSFDKDFQVSEIKKAGSRCWVIIGGKDLVGYDINTRQKSVDNATLVNQFHQFADGISKVEDLNNIEGFKVTSKEGFTYYYLPEVSKIFTEVEFDNVRRNENMNNTSWAFQTQYVFSDGEQQQLYKLIRRHQNLRIRKIYPNEVKNLLEDESLWYRKMYNVVSIEEFTPGKIYFNSNMLYYDNDYCVFISTAEPHVSSPFRVQCLDKNRNLKWSVSAEDLELFEPFLTAGNIDAFRKNNELVFQIPYQLAISVNMYSGKINWTYKLVKTPA